jgi:hypothetical protein
MRDMDELFAALGRSAFRSRFRLACKEAEYLGQKGLAKIREHARDFVTTRLSGANPANDGRQTPMKNHPVFVAQHATASCCRGCLAKWHGIPKGKPLTEEEIGYLFSELTGRRSRPSAYHSILPPPDESSTFP